MTALFNRNAKLAVAAIMALWLLHAIWQLGLSSLPLPLRLALLSIALLPGLPCLLAWLRNRRSAAFWAGAGSLFYFSHGVMEAWAAEQWRLLAFVEIALALLAIFASSIDGVRARFAKRGTTASR
ncbi:MAG: DUF2069 domain-containing protein [Xanthomonadaceae bacterium]|nr:DUF2069 domain-containing protein [Xanthomonadaceae bacterium]MDP2184637.1 DUF2069 domain-containing protein [Xanthomonadales bacterium]MDZ4117195.1 DUF2069 domain-containing protein [Xanthomonadaceae bacterium]MDZ4377129.1 DUF2069 domain-containing protein [Xanthomonadaceae bacterium]